MNMIVNYSVYVPASVTARLNVTKVTQLRFYFPLMNWEPIQVRNKIISSLNYFVIPTKCLNNHYHPFNISFRLL